MNNMRLWAMPGDLHVEFSTPNSYFVILPEPGSDGNVYLHIANVTVPVSQSTCLYKIKDKISS